MQPWEITKMNKDLFERLSTPDLSDLDFTPSHVLQLLESYTSIWKYKLPVCSSSAGKTLRLDADVTGELNDTILMGIRQPFIFRLNFIRQLSTSFLWTGLGGSHTRLAHSIGTVLVAQKFLDSIVKNDITLEPWEKKAVLIFALIHDSCHGPFGHVLDLLRGMLFPKDRNKLDKFCLDSELKDIQSELRSLIRMLIPKEEERNKAIVYLQLFLDKGKFKELYPKRYFLAQILDSRFDADRLDFVHRDSRHLGVSPYLGSNELQTTIERVRVVEDNEDRGVSKIAFDIRDRRYLENTILMRRRDLYQDYYENPDRVATDEMVAHLIYYVLQHVALGVSSQATHKNSKINEKIVKHLLCLTDEQLFSFLHSVRKPLHCTNLLIEVLGGHSYREVFSEDLEYDPKGTIKRIKQVQESWEKVLNKKNAFEIGDDDREAMATVYKDTYSTCAYEALLGEMAYLYYGDFENKLKLEDALWKQLLSNNTFKCYFENDYQIQRFGNLEEAIQYPHIHISLPTYLAQEVSEQKEYAKEETMDTPLWHTDGQVIERDLDIPAGEKFVYHKVVISCPPEFLESEEATEFIIATFKKLVEDFTWVTGDVINRTWRKETAKRAEQD